ncbi:MAG TPA: hypothetical protein DET40_06610 [Lentisphaeria bacterium]|nr:MAG: hypothetical protein A2X45_17515 [Lentisphaerae bacterium GWF2_50_93]HCE43200.1 hypothetical protein [Lentisphaeria bacterium]
MLIIVPRFNLWYTFPPLGALYIAAVVKEKGGKVSLLDSNEYSEKDFYSRLDSEIMDHPEVGITANVSLASSAHRIARYIRGKYPDRKIIWGGPYSTVEYERLIPEYADIVVLGEGETQAAGIVEGRNLQDIPGIAWYDGDRIKVNERPPFIEDLDKLPFPAWELINPESYVSPGRKPSFSMITQRGCPFKCINCSTFMQGNTFRSRSPENVADEIEMLVKKYNCREMHIFDDNFTLKPDRTKKICAEIIRRGLNKHVRFVLTSGIRADIIDEEMFDLLKEAGVYFINVAVESGDQEVIDKIGKGLDLKKVPVILNTLEKRGFRIGLFFMMGFPFESKESMKKTADFAASLPGHHAHFFIVTPFPGTKLYEMAKDVYKPLDKYEKVTLNFYDENIRYAAPEFTSGDLEDIHRYAYRKFYLKPGRLFGIAKAMLRDGGWYNDIGFLIKNFYNIMLFGGHR